MGSDFNNIAKLLSHGVVSVGTTPTQLVSSPSEGIEYIKVYNDGNNTMYYGGPSVTTSGPNRGIPVEKNQFAILPCTDSGELYAIVSSGTEDAIVLQWGND